jgi:hypothetical protein
MEFELVMQSAEAADTSSFTAFVSPVTVLYENDFETDIDGWSHARYNGLDDWTWADARGLMNHCDPKEAASGTKMVGNDLNEAGRLWEGLYPNESGNWLESPSVDCSEATGVHLVFNRWVTVEEGVWDDAIVKVNGIEVWRNQPNGHHLDRAWIPVCLDISSIADGASDVKVRFDLMADEWLHWGGWNIDDFMIVATSGGGQAVEHDGPAPQFLAVSSHPNPFAPVTRLQLAIPVASDNASVRVFDTAGRMVRTIHEGPLTAGVHRLTWIGTDDEGSPLPGGTYYCRARANGETTVTKIVRVQ